MFHLFIGSAVGPNQLGIGVTQSRDSWHSGSVSSVYLPGLLVCTRMFVSVFHVGKVLEAYVWLVGGYGDLLLPTHDDWGVFSVYFIRC